MATRAKAATVQGLSGGTWTRDGESASTVAMPRGATEAQLSTAGTGFARSRLRFRRFGEDISEPLAAPASANGVALSWPTGRGLPLVICTKNGLLLPALQLAPAEANRLHVGWRARRLAGARWMRGEEALSPVVPLPDNATDIHLHLIWR